MSAIGCLMRQASSRSAEPFAKRLDVLFGNRHRGRPLLAIQPVSGRPTREWPRPQCVVEAQPQSDHEHHGQANCARHVDGVREVGRRRDIHHALDDAEIRGERAPNASRSALAMMTRQLPRRGDGGKWSRCGRIRRTRLVAPGCAQQRDGVFIGPAACMHGHARRGFHRHHVDAAILAHGSTRRRRASCPRPYRCPSRTGAHRAAQESIAGAHRRACAAPPERDRRRPRTWRAARRHGAGFVALHHPFPPRGRHEARRLAPIALVPPWAQVACERDVRVLDGERFHLHHGSPNPACTSASPGRAYR